MSDKRAGENWNQIVWITLLPVLSGALLLSNDLEGGVRYGVSGALIVALVLAVYKVGSSIWRAN